MARAAILVVDVQPEELARLGQELRKRYGQDYEILEASSGGEALETLRARQLAERPGDVKGNAKDEVKQLAQPLSSYGFEQAVDRLS